MRIGALLVATLWALAGCSSDTGNTAADSLCAAANETLATMPERGRTVRYAFYSDFRPLSFANSQDPDSPDFHSALGYEPALARAASVLSGGKLHLEITGVGNPFQGIWLLPGTDEQIDMVGGGITALPQRRFAPDIPAEPLVTFGVGHVQFRQSLLVRHDSDIHAYADLAGKTVAALHGTTGEARLLQLLALADDKSLLAEGTRILLGNGETVVADGQSQRISAAAATPELRDRIALSGPTNRSATLVYQPDEATALRALNEGRVDAFARGAIGNAVAAQQSDGLLRIAVFDERQVEQGAFVYAASAEGDEVRHLMDSLLGCLTRGGDIGFDDWYGDRQVFMRRAERYAPR